MNDLPRLRMFAGPNGSGKSTIKSVIRSELLGIYINPDEIEKDIRNGDFLDLQAFGVRTTAAEILAFFQNSTLLAKADLLEEAEYLSFNDDKLSFHNVIVNSYFASVAADFIRHKLLETGTSFTFETVMSSPDKIAFLQKAQRRGYRTYLYYVATEDPIINILRVQRRVSLGGHPVPEDKIVARYTRSLDLLVDAIRHTNRAYIFDNSTHQQIWTAEITDGEFLEMKTDRMPAWFKIAVWDKFSEI
ncbi:zeta toxin family protein [Chamaesiphon sp. VAR_48_metabat_135_sub]|uniref:zeta toxin family protein n=1 Tax=Chamaesiphon sp. VAR_48_metabat_135_sub TaxID=2964699 RepID=UPI00286C2B89|nr:zeta toxin family protein [Chamaesiphon sp. VAR_48_metabat_135_sub]